MLDKIEYNQNFTTTYVEANQRMEPYKDVITMNYPAISFTRQVFKKYPKLLGMGAETLFYIEYAGRVAKPEMLYDMFETTMTNSMNDIITAIINDKPTYTIDQDSFIAWARILQSTSSIVTYEPVMGVCSEVLNSFLKNNRQYIYKTQLIRLQEIKPICYTNVGENICDLLPYIAYIYNFFINCHPYLFNDLTSGSNIQLFLNLVNNMFNVFYMKLIKDGRNIKILNEKSSEKFFNLDHFFSDVDNILSYSESTTTDMYKNMLSTDSIIPIRNKVLIESITDEGTSSQNNISPSICEAGFMNVLENLTEIVINKNYITLNIFNKISRFDNQTVDYHTLALLTEYCVSGGNTPFGINSSEQFEGCLEPSTIYTYPTIQKQQLKTDINVNVMSTTNPFISSNVYSEIATGYVSQKFIEHQNDTFNNEPITIDESLVDTETFSDMSMSEKLVSLYVNGKWMTNNSQLNIILSLLYKIPSFKNELLGIHYLGKICYSFLGDKFNSSIIPAYILSFLPEYLLNYMINNRKQALDKFSLMIYLCLHHNYDNNKITKIQDIEKSIMYLYNKKYTSFVNSKIVEITKILTMNGYIIQPYAKGISNNIDMYAIGGIGLVDRAVLTNPLLRAYYFILSTQGNSESMQTFYEWIRNITDKNMIELIYNSINDNNYNFLGELLNQAYDKFIKTNNVPNTLLNYNIHEDLTYSIKTYAYFIELQTSTNIPICKLLSTYTFPMAQAKDTQSIEIMTRSIIYRANKFIALKPLNGYIDFNDKRYNITMSNIGIEYDIPYYDYSAEFKQIMLSFEQPSAYKILQIYTPSGSIFKNNLFFVFTKLDFGIFGDKTYENAYQNIFQTTLPSLQTSVSKIAGLPNIDEKKFATNRIGMFGVNKMPIPSGNNNI